MKTVYFYDMQGNFVNSYEIKESEAMPENGTAIAPPELSEDYSAVYNGADWTIQRVQKV